MSEIDLLIQELRDTIDNQKETIEQLENIRKEAIAYINKNWGHWCSNHCKYATETINILNKGDNK